MNNVKGKMMIKHNKGETYTRGMSLTYPKYASVKLDGIRVSGQDGTLITNSGKEPPNQALIQKFAPLVQGLDGEFIYGDPADLDVYTKTFSAVMRKNGGTADGVTFHVFDVFLLEAEFRERLAFLQGQVALQHAAFTSGSVSLLPQVLVNNEGELLFFYEEALASGYEGMILRNPTALYKQGRSTLASQDLLKCKPLRDAEFVVGDVYEAQTNLNEATKDAFGHTERSSHAANKVGNGMLGGFNATWENGKSFKIAPGKLTHQERVQIWENQETYRGRIGIYTYMDYGIVDVPRHGRFKAWTDAIVL